MMTAQSTDQHPRARVNNLIWLALILAGLVGNALHFSIINAHFIFGSIFAMLALQLFGLGRGVIAAGVIASYTYFAWNHPWAVVTMTVEVAVAGWLFSRRKMSLLMADTLYWLLIGIPIGYVGFHLISHFPVSNSLFLLSKQAVNGIANALAARLIFVGIALLRRPKRELVAFRELVANLLTLFVLATALVILTIDSRTDLAEIDRNIRASLKLTSQQASDGLTTWVADRLAPIAHLAELAATHAPDQMQARLEQARAADPNFQRLALIDRAGVVIAYAPPIDELGQSNLGKSFADRPYIPALKQRLTPMLSEVMASRFGDAGPIVSMLAPVLSPAAEYQGAVGGIMNFERITTVLTAHVAGTTLRYTLTDHRGDVILSSRGDQTALTPFARGEGTLQRLDDGLAQWIPALPPNTSTIELWGQSWYVVESAIGTLAEWTLIVEQPVAPFQKAIYDRYTRKFFMLSAIVVVSIGLAGFLSRRILRSIEQLSRLTHALPEKLASDQQIVWPDSAVRETHDLIANFSAMAASLTAQFTAIERLNASLEAQVEQRTAELRAREAALQESEERFRAAFEHASIGMTLTAPDGRLLKVNRAFCAMLGYEFDDLQGVNFADLTHPDDAGVSRECVRCLLAGEQATWHFYKRYRHRAGQDVWTEVHTTLLRDADGQPRYFITHVQDITARKQAEEKIREKDIQFRKLSLNVPGLIFQFTRRPDGTYYVPIASVGIKNIFGCSPEDVLEDFAAIGRVLHPDDAARVLRDIEDSAEHVTFFTCEFRVQIPGKGVQWIYSQSTPEKLADGSVTWYGFNTDITAHKRAEAEIRQLNAELEQRVRDRTAALEAANTELEAFSYSVSHDLRAPLRHIAGFVELLNKRAPDRLDDKSQHYLQVISEAAQRMGNLIDDLLSFSRTGRVEMLRQRVNLARLCQDVIALIQEDLSDREIVWSVGDLPEVSGDPAMLRLVWENLIGNAVKFTRGRAPAIIEIGHRADNPQEDVFYVRDNGAGFDEKYVDKLFGLFQRLHRTEEFEGTGLGLANVRRIIHRHGGRTWAASILEQGATVYFSLPKT